MSSIADSSHDKITDSTATGKDDTSYDEVVDKTSTANINKRIVIEVVPLLLTIGFVWLVLLIPIIVFHLPDEVFLSQVSTHN